MKDTAKINLRFGVLVLLIVLAAFSRMIPHMANFSPLGVIGLFGAAHFSRKGYALLIPIAATWLSDLFINNVIYRQYYPEFTWFYGGFYWQYGSYLLITLLGIFLFRKKVTLPRIVAGTLAAGLLFFAVTNYACWTGSTCYSQDLPGLLHCYAAGIPYYKGTLLGDLFYSGLLFGSFYLLQLRFPVLREQRS